MTVQHKVRQPRKMQCLQEGLQNKQGYPVCKSPMNYTKSQEKNTAAEMQYATHNRISSSMAYTRRPANKKEENTYTVMKVRQEYPEVPHIKPYTGGMYTPTSW